MLKILVLTFGLLTSFAGLANEEYVTFAADSHKTPYQLFVELGQGGYGKVYLAIGPAGQIVVKLLLDIKGDIPRANAKLVHEQLTKLHAVLSERFSNVPLLEVGPFDQIQVTKDGNLPPEKRKIERYAEGYYTERGMYRSLSTIFGELQLRPSDDDRTWQTKRAAIFNIAIAVLRALNYLHNLPEYVPSGKPIIHSDVKPANILFRYNDAVDPVSVSAHIRAIAEGDLEPVLADFDLSRVVGEPTELWQQNALKGTPLYIDPYYATQIINDPTTPPLNSFRSDAWALGALLYELMGGDNPLLESVENKDARMEEVARALKGNETFTAKRRANLEEFLRDHKTNSQSKFLLELTAAALDATEPGLEHLAKIEGLERSTTAKGIRLDEKITAQKFPNAFLSMGCKDQNAALNPPKHHSQASTVDR